MSDKLTVSVEEEENGEVGPGNNGNGGKRTKSPFEGTVVVKVFYKIHRNSIRSTENRLCPTFASQSASNLRKKKVLKRCFLQKMNVQKS